MNWEIIKYCREEFPQRNFSKNAKLFNKIDFSENSIAGKTNPIYNDINPKEFRWTKWYYDIDGIVISMTLLEKILKEFWVEVIETLPDNMAVIIQWILDDED